MPTKPFNIHVPDEVLMDLKARLNHVRWPSQVKNLLWDRGTNLEYLQALVSYCVIILIGAYKKRN